MFLFIVGQVTECASAMLTEARAASKPVLRRY